MTVDATPSAGATAQSSGAGKPAPVPAAPDAAPRLLARLELAPAQEGEQPCAVITADLDGDGRDELYSAARGPGSLQVRTALSAAPVASSAPRSIAIGDYPIGPVWFGAPGAQGSGSARLVLASRATNEVTWIDARALLAGGEASPIVRRLALEKRPRVIASGDLGHDGTPDLALVDVEDQLWLFRGEAPPARLRLCDTHATAALLVADGGGFVFAFQGTRRIVAYTETSSNPFGYEPAANATLAGLPRALAEADVDGDGDLELLVVQGERSLSIFGLGAPGGPLAGLAAPARELETGAVPIAIATGDFDRDGKLEIAALARSDQRLDVFAWQPSVAGGFVRRASLYAGQHPWSLAAGDLDGDHALDLAIANPDAGRVSVLFGDGRGGLASAELVRTGGSPGALAAGDLDGDGRPEIVGIDALDGRLSLYENRSGKLAEARRIALAPNGDAPACADLDGDGDLDVAYLDRTLAGGDLRVLLGDGAKGFVPAELGPEAQLGGAPSALLLADLDRDGKVEIVAADPESGALLLLERVSPTGAPLRFGAPRRLEIANGPRSLALVAAPDGATEIAVALGGPTGRIGVALLRARRENGELALAESGFLATTLVPRAVCAADFDGGGGSDLALLATESGGDSAGFFVPLVRDPSAGLRALEPLPAGARPFAIACGDLDGDGRDDAVVSAQNSHHLNLYVARHAPETGFARCADLGVGVGPLGLVVCDLDGDGRPEIVAANAFSNELAVIAER